MLKLDLHVHSCYSEDGEGSPEEIIKIVKKKKLDGIAFTDHNTIEGGLKALKFASKDFIVIPGVEVSTKDGHILALNVKGNIPRGFSAEETIEKIKDNGGIPVVPHLFRNMSGIKKKKLEQVYTRISAIEVFNSCSLPQSNLKTMKVAEEFKLGGTGGSDTHVPEYAGEGYTLVDTSDFNVDTVISEINKKKTWGGGNILPFSYRRDRMIKSTKQFFQRGLKRI